MCHGRRVDPFRCDQQFLGVLRYSEVTLLQLRPDQQSFPLEDGQIDECLHEEDVRHPSSSSWRVGTGPGWVGGRVQLRLPRTGRRGDERMEGLVPRVGDYSVVLG